MVQSPLSRLFHWKIQLKPSEHGGCATSKLVSKRVRSILFEIEPLPRKKRFILRFPLKLPFCWVLSTLVWQTQIANYPATVGVIPPLLCQIQTVPNPYQIHIIILSYTIVYYHILSYTIIYYRILSYTIIYYHILPYTIIYYHMLSFTIIYYHILSYTIIYYIYIILYIIYIYKYIIINIYPQIWCFESMFHLCWVNIYIYMQCTYIYNYGVHCISVSLSVYLSLLPIFMNISDLWWVSDTHTYIYINNPDK